MAVSIASHPVVAIPHWIASGPGLTLQERGVLAHMLGTLHHGDGGDIATTMISPRLSKDDPGELQNTLDGLVDKGLLTVESKPICDGPVYSLNLPVSAL
jgi:hypothetical protein